MESITNKKIDLYNAHDTNGIPLYTTAQLNEMTDIEVQQYHDTLKADTFLIGEFRKKEVTHPPMREESGNIWVSIGLASIGLIALLIYYMITL